MTTSGKEVFDGRPETVWETAKEIEAGPEPPHEPLVSWQRREELRAKRLGWGWPLAIRIVIFWYIATTLAAFAWRRYGWFPTVWVVAESWRRDRAPFRPFVQRRMEAAEAELRDAVALKEMAHG